MIQYLLKRERREGSLHKKRFVGKKADPEILVEWLLNDEGRAAGAVGRLPDSSPPLSRGSALPYPGRFSRPTSPGVVLEG